MKPLTPGNISNLTQSTQETSPNILESVADTDYTRLPPPPSLLTVSQFCKLEAAFTIGGMRHLLFTKGHDLPGVYRFGRKLLIDRAEFIEGVKQGHTAQICKEAK